MNVRVDKDLLLKFFLTFSAFEYALKSSGLFKRHRVEAPKFPNAEPDWDSFAVSLRECFDPETSTELREACEYLLDSPPSHQVLTSTGIAWETPVRSCSETEIEFLLRMVRCVRNNLFHGGKFNADVHEDAVRTQLLLSHSIVVLMACLELAPDLNAVYQDAIL
jgi:hypothetical protein